MANTISITPDRTNQSAAIGLVVALVVTRAVIGAGFVWARDDVGVPNTGDTSESHIQIHTGGTVIPADATD